MLKDIPEDETKLVVGDIIRARDNYWDANLRQQQALVTGFGEINGIRTINIEFEQGYSTEFYLNFTGAKFGRLFQLKSKNPLHTLWSAIKNGTEVPPDVMERL